MVNAAIVVFTAVIAYNAIFQFFTVRADFLLKWGNQRDNCSGNASSATVMVDTGGKNHTIWDFDLSRCLQNKILRQIESKYVPKSF